MSAPHRASPYVTNPKDTTMTTIPTPIRTSPRARLLAGVGALSLAAALGACSTGTADAGGDTAAAAPETTEAAALTIADPWVKAADAGMTAAFGTLENGSDTDVRIVSATSEVTSSMELHEMATGDDGAMVMQQKAGGFVLEAGGSHELSPGGDHLMFMDLTTPVQPGDEVAVTLTAEDGSTFEFTAPARSFSGANEEYHGDGGDMEGMEGMEDADDGAGHGSGDSGQDDGEHADS
ncbi:copper chaperone PCu(A)C [Cellulosimicrobium sp. CUA-896]|uniref:copper chaperone PCu(A)C n=1 Tax=Cellulosimicrobium sp. CUA-896 TaxID=1517881 RepID=UPI00095FD297|nr:copper chaperone PCu(A)C [Cellulosimicrobium sp. CUA-896]OLT52618.1 hypothetical protein BJF88_13420 [Cellulosimicrobium sp. CUA-896]